MRFGGRYPITIWIVRSSSRERRSVTGAGHNRSSAGFPPCSSVPTVRQVELLYVTEGVPNRDPVLGDGSSMIPFEVIRNAPADVRITLVTFIGEVPVPDEIRSRCDHTVLLAVRDQRLALVRSIPSELSIGAQQRTSGRAVRTVRALSRRADVTLVHGPHAAVLTHAAVGPVVASR